MKLLYGIGILYILICVIFTAQKVFSFPFQPNAHIKCLVNYFRRFGVVQNYLSILQSSGSRAYLAKIPPPNTVEGSGYAAACLALANKIDRARVVIVDLNEKDRPKASEILLKWESRLPMLVIAAHQRR